MTPKHPRTPLGSETAAQPVIEPLGFFLLRAPLFSFDELRRLSDGMRDAERELSNIDLQAWLATERAEIRQKIRTFLRNADAREALMLASPALLGRLHVWDSAPDSQDGRKLETAVMRYMSRMCARATPFGMFALVGTGTVGDVTRIELPLPDRVRRHVRVDSGVLTSICARLVSRPELRDRLLFYGNSSIYRLAGQIRYIEFDAAQATRAYHLAAVDGTSEVETALRAAAGGATLETIARALLDGELELTEATEFVQELVDAQLLVPELQVPLTGADALTAIVSRIEERAPDMIELDDLRSVQMELARLNSTPLGGVGADYEPLMRLIERLAPDTDPRATFHAEPHVDTLAATISPAVLEEITRGVHLLHSLTASAESGLHGDLKRFRIEFEDRFGEQEVQLAAALDEENGITWGRNSGRDAHDAQPLIDGIGGRAPHRASHSADAPSPAHVVLLRRVTEALQQSARAVVLTPSDLNAMRTEQQLPLPHSLSAIVEIAAASAGAVEAGQFSVVLRHAFGPSGAMWPARFSQGNAALAAWLGVLTDREAAARPDVIFAEVVHLPQGRFGNFIARARLRRYEIPYLGLGSAEANDQISVSDLWLSVRGGRLVLRSHRLGREIVPRLSSAHNPGGATYDLAVYRFLHALQYQDTAMMHWDIGVAGALPFVPRITTGRLVLSLATWRVSPQEGHRFTQIAAAERFSEIQRWRANRGIDRYVVVREADNRLVLDLENPLCVDTLIQLLSRRNGDVALTELFPVPDELVAKRDDERFISELVVPFAVRAADSGLTAPPVSTRQESPSPGDSRHARVRSLQRRFTPGSEWAFLKLYTGTAMADRLLLRELQSLTAWIRESTGAHQWFFVRYADPEFHLRIRVSGSPSWLWGELMPYAAALLHPLVENGALHRIQLDTYDREVERYGGPDGVVLAEQVFHADSIAVQTGLAALLKRHDAAAQPWHFAIAGVDRLLSDAKLDDEAQSRVLSHLVAVYDDAFGDDADGAVRRQIASRFRHLRAEMQAVLARRSTQPGMIAAMEALDQRSEAHAPLMAQLRGLHEGGTLTQPFEHIISSFVHMHVNRCLRASHRRHERVLYDLLRQHKRSERARSAATEE